ncbi:MAG TPA: serine hydrolase, partial [Candidatus Cryosericum sp.]|nr:serine hydrolase [Candidatus Cryosericum sp.]
MNEGQIAALERTIANSCGNIAGMIVLRDGEKQYENYFNGFDAGSAFHVFSVTKSVLSILIGIAVGRGQIGSVDEKVLGFFPDYVPKRGERTAQRVTIRDMLTMTAPFKYKSAPYTKYFSSESWVKSALDLLGGKGEIGQFRYTPLIGPDILSGILTKATGQSALAFAQDALFRPLGIDVTRTIVFQTKEEQLSLVKERHTSGWVADPLGINTAGWGLFLTPTDMANIGQLYLNNGIWNGEQIVSSAWIAESTREHSRCKEWGNLAYGYLWWLIDENSFAALGDGGNAIYVNRKKNLVVAIASLFKPSAAD